MKRPPLTRRWSLTRRELMKLAPLGALTAAAAGAGAAMLLPSTAEAKVRGTCRFCLMHCGIVATARGGRLVRVEGDLQSRTRGFLCLHGHALRDVVHARDRLATPLMRAGDAFVALSWDDALGEIAQRLNAIKAKHGPESFLIQTGWPLVRHPLIDVLHRFARAFGSPNVATVASLCEASARMGQALTVGSKLAPDYQRAKTLVLWGANPWRSAPPFAQLVARKAEQGALVVIDPVRHESAERASAFLQVRPGADGLLALAMIHVVLSERLYPEPFTSEWVEGLDGLRALAARHVPGDVAATTGIPAARIAEVARRFATDAPTCIWPGLGVEHHAAGVQTIRAITALEALCGRFVDEKAQAAFLTPERGEGLLPALYAMRTPEPVPPPVAAKPLGYDRFPLFEVYNREAQGNLWPAAALTGAPYPIRALMLVASNALVTAPDPAETARACEKLELIVTVDTFLSASAQRSDFVLPAAGFAETTDGEKPPLVPTQRDAWPDWKIVFALAQRLGLGAYFPWATFTEALAAPRVPWLADPEHQPRAEPAARRRFPTPSGKIEFHSRVLERFGVPPLPEWTPPVATTPEFPLRLVIGPRTAAFINSQFRTIDEVRSKLPEPVLLLNPADAPPGATRVRLVSPHGEAEVKVDASGQVAPGVAVLPAGWDTHDFNRLLGPCALDPISGFPAFRSGIVRVVPLRAGAAPRRPVDGSGDRRHEE